MPQDELDRFLRTDKSGDRYTGEQDSASGLYNIGGSIWPLTAVGQSAIVILERPAGGYDVVMQQRASHMFQGDRWGFFGGYLDIIKGEGPLDGMYRELIEESKGIIDLKAHIPQPLLPFMDYNDTYSKACYVMGYLFTIRGQEAQDLRARIEDAIARKDYDSEVQKIEIVPVDDKLDAVIAAKGGLAYVQETYFLAQSRAILNASAPSPQPSAPKPQARHDYPAFH